MVLAKFRLFRDDVEFFEAIAYAAAIMRFPVLRKVDVYPGLLPLDSDPYQGLYKFNCFATDLQMLHDLAQSLVKSRMSMDSLAATKVEASRKAAAYDPVDTTPPMSFK
jgi:hypothetical protein